jgi:hypothetical protein
MGRDGEDDAGGCRARHALLLQLLALRVDLDTSALLLQHAMLFCTPGANADLDTKDTPESLVSLDIRLFLVLKGFFGC